jgi:hypothetical protein
MLLKPSLRYDMVAISIFFALLIFVIVFGSFGASYRSLVHGNDRTPRNVSK